MTAVPKPEFKKQKKAKNNPVPTEAKRCALCGAMGICETHEVFGGSNRQTSIEHGYQVPLHRKCHELVTRNDESTLMEQEIWRKEFQMRQEVAWWQEGELTMKEARDKWIQLIGRNYL